MQNIHKTMIIGLIFAIAVGSFLVTGCKGSYRYYSYRSKAEEALKKKKFKQAQELYSIIYQEENKESAVEAERTTWAFYRLGVIAEVMGDIRMAKGYYWGDKIDEGFYLDFPETDWFAQAGWNCLDEGNPPRTIEAILEFEARGLPKTANAPDRKKREIVVPADTVRKPIVESGDTRPQRTFNRSLTPPRPGLPEPFRVFY